MMLYFAEQIWIDSNDLWFLDWNTSDDICIHIWFCTAIFWEKKDANFSGESKRLTFHFFRIKMGLLTGKLRLVLGSFWKYNEAL